MVMIDDHDKENYNDDDKTGLSRLRISSTLH